MRKNSDKIQMMDAGTALFTGKDGFGSAIGTVKAEMEVYGKTLRPGEFRPEDLPAAVRDCDLLMDSRTGWRRRIIACKVEDAGSTGKRTEDGKEIRRYAAVFKEGHCGTGLRGAVHGILCAVLLAFMVPGFLPGVLSERIAALPAAAGAFRILAGILLLLVTLYSWMAPSRNAPHVVNQIQLALRTPPSPDSPAK